LKYLYQKGEILHVGGVLYLKQFFFKGKLKLSDLGGVV